MVTLVKHDLEYILKQIKIAEAHTAGGDLATLVAEAGGLGGDAGTANLQAHLLPYGLRTVDGTYNNLLPGRETWGAADQPFIPLTTPDFRHETNDAPFHGVVNQDYGAPGNIVDSDPRTISNLIVDQTSKNPAAVIVAQQWRDAGYTVTETPVYNGANQVFHTDSNGIQVLDENGQPIPVVTFHFPNISPDIGDSAPFNGIFTLFGQFFDHGLDLVPKAGNGTILIPLKADDPLYVVGSPTNFMAMSRATLNPDNITTPHVDQNQTYTSDPSHQVFLREYAMVDGKPVATGHLLEGARGLATWADVKLQAREMLGIELTDADIFNIPMVRVDAYGNFIPDENGFAQLVTGIGPDNIPNTADDEVISGTPGAPVGTETAVRIAHAFLDDIGHAAVPNSNIAGQLMADSDSDIGNTNLESGTYDNELLDAHYITGDGRGNENVGLSTIHHVFHGEHNRLVEHTKDVVLASNDLAFLNEWLTGEPLTEWPTDISTLAWNGERLFHTARFTNEMEYQHLVFEEFARKMQPDIDAFVFEPSADINPAIFAEFAHAVYRFGHSMLTEGFDVIHIGPDGKPLPAEFIPLFDAFLNPLSMGAVDAEGLVTMDHNEAMGALIRGMTRQAGNEIDEFVTNALRNQLLGIPLDLAAINIARGRDTGLPSLNEARAQFYQIANQDSQLKPYESWADFALNLKNPASIVNFIAAYGMHESLTAQSSLDGKRAAAAALVLGGEGAPGDRMDFLNSTGRWNNDNNGLNTVDLWMGGMAEKHMDFGGMLGSTFSFVFELQLENLQDGDRFYYLSRVQGLNLLNELENNTLGQMIMRNTNLGDEGATALPGDIFSTPDHTIELDISRQIGDDPVFDDPFLAGVSQKVVRVDANNDGVAEKLVFNGGEHVVIGGTEGNDIIVAGDGDDTVWGYGGDDTIEGGYGVDRIFGGDGDDIITNAGTDIGEADFLHGGNGNDAIHGGSGLALIFGNAGQDFIITGPDGKEAFGGLGNDFIRGGDGVDFLLGNEGDDWLEGGGRFDTLAGENSELFFNSSIIGHDVMNGGGNDTDYDAESGDDIMFQSDGIQRSNGMAGFDWAIHKGDHTAANSDLGIPLFATQEAFILRDRFDLVEGLSGWKYDDVLTGRRESTNARAELDNTAAIPGANSILDSYSNALLLKNVSLIDGLDQLVGHLMPAEGDTADPNTIVLDTADASDILLGGGGSDTIMGLAGNDIIDGDSWLNVRIGIKDAANNVIGWADGMTEQVKGPGLDGSTVLFGGRTLDALVFSRDINPGNLYIIREIVNGNSEGDIDTAVYTDVVENYTFTRNDDGSITVAHTGFDEDNFDGEEGVDVRPLSDGVDRLFNIEVLRFSDGNGGVVNIPVEQLFNIAATGAPAINDLTPTEGMPLIASQGDIADENGIGTGDFTYQWQMSVDNGTTWTDIAGATEATYTPANDVATEGAPGTVLRVAATFTDAQGNIETRVSDVTGVVGDNYAGTNGADTFLGTLGDDIANGGGGDDYLVGGVGDDILNGAGGADELEGGAGNDTLTGGAGDDLLIGGAGDDALNGGGGTDTAVYMGAASNFSVDRVGGTIVVTDNTGAEGVDTLNANIEILQFGGIDYTVVNGTNAANANLNGVGGTAGSQIIFGMNGADTINGGGGNDIINAGAGDDTITQVGNTGGRDFVDGGAGTDTYQLNNSTGNITIYTRTQAALAFAGANFHEGTEIVIARGSAIIAELDNIEEIRVNSLQVIPGSPGGGANVSVVGDFSETSLALNTITIEGSAGNDTVDISSLLSAHRIVFRSNGGTDTIVGALRPQDVIVLPDGVTQADSVTTAADGMTTISSPGHAITFATEGAPQVQLANGDAFVIEPQSDHDHGSDDDDDDYDDDHGGATQPPAGGSSGHDDDDDDHHHHHHNHGGKVLNGTSRDDTLNGKSGDDTINGGSGDDTLNGGSGDDMLNGGSGDDMLNGGSGDDMLNGGSGDDYLNGGSGDDILAGGSGDDVLNGGSGDDILNGGSGDDILIGGSGDDIFVFGKGDLITDFSVGDDKVDLRDLGITVGNFAALVSMTAAGNDMLLTVNGDSMKLSDVDFDDIGIDSFMLAGADAGAATDCYFAA